MKQKVKRGLRFRWLSATLLSRSFHGLFPLNPSPSPTKTKRLNHNGGFPPISPKAYNLSPSAPPFCAPLSSRIKRIKHCRFLFFSFRARLARWHCYVASKSGLFCVSLLVANTRDEKQTNYKKREKPRFFFFFSGR